MPVLASKLNTRSEGVRANAAAMRALVDDLNTKLAQIVQGGGEGPRQKHLARGSCCRAAACRCCSDPDSPFLEVAPLAALDVDGNDAPDPHGQADLACSGALSLPTGIDSEAAPGNRLGTRTP